MRARRCQPPGTIRCLRFARNSGAESVEGGLYQTIPPGHQSGDFHKEPIVADYNTALSAHSPKMLSVLRIMSALLFVAHGSQKLLNFPLRKDGGPGPDVFTMFWFAGMLELCGGILLAIGLFTRPVAFVLSGLMAFAYFIAHAPQNFFPVLNGGDAAILFCFVFLYFVFAGPGPWSVDATRSRTLY